MKKLLKLIAFVCLSLPAFAQNLATVSASNIQDLNGAKLAAGQLCFLGTDNNDNPISFQVGGGGQVLKRSFCSAVAAGVVTSFTVPNPANTSPTGIYYRVTVKDSSTGVEVLRYTGVTFSGGTFGFDTYTPNITGASFSPLSGTSVTGNLSVSGNLSVTGSFAPGSITTGAGSFSTVTATGVSRFAAIDRIFKMCWVDGTTYTTIASAYGDTANCNSVWLPPGYTETLAANLVLSRSSVPIVATGTATITMGTNRITAAGTVNGVSFVGLTCGMGSGANQCFKFTYTGTSSAFAIGDSTTHSKSFYMHGVEIDTTGNGAIALQLNNLDQFVVEDTSFSQNSGTSPISIVTNGTGQFVGSGAFDKVFIGGAATNGIGYQFQTLSTNIQIVGGNLALDVGASAVCFDVQGASTQSIELMNVNANTCNTAVKVESTATSVGAIVGDFRIDSGVTTVASYATGTQGNQLRCVNCPSNPTVSDSGSNNSLEIPFNNQINGVSWRTIQAANDYELQNKATGKDRFAATTVNTFVDTESTGTLLINSLSGGTGGEEFCHGDNTHCLIMNPSPTANRTWTIQDASGTVPLEIASGTSTFTTTAVGAGACQTTVTTAATNTLTTDTITTSYTSAPGAATDSLLILNAWPTAGNVNFSRCNPTAGSITPTALVLNWRVMR